MDWVHLGALGLVRFLRGVLVLWNKGMVNGVQGRGSY